MPNSAHVRFCVFILLKSSIKIEVVDAFSNYVSVSPILLKVQYPWVEKFLSYIEGKLNCAFSSLIYNCTLKKYISNAMVTIWLLAIVLKYTYLLTYINIVIVNQPANLPDMSSKLSAVSKHTRQV